MSSLDGFEKEFENRINVIVNHRNTPKAARRDRKEGLRYQADQEAEQVRQKKLTIRPRIASFIRREAEFVAVELVSKDIFPATSFWGFVDGGYEATGLRRLLPSFFRYSQEKIKCFQLSSRINEAREVQKSSFTPRAETNAGSGTYSYVSYYCEGLCLASDGEIYVYRGGTTAKHDEAKNVLFDANIPVQLSYAEDEDLVPLHLVEPELHNVHEQPAVDFFRSKYLAILD